MQKVMKQVRKLGQKGFMRGNDARN